MSHANKMHTTRENPEEYITKIRSENNMDYKCSKKITKKLGITEIKTIT
jgi:hypothetical protein